MSVDFRDECNAVIEIDLASGEVLPFVTQHQLSPGITVY